MGGEGGKVKGGVSWGGGGCMGYVGRKSIDDNDDRRLRDGN